ncbi:MULTISPECIES: YqcC family protein [unclassified Brenneria]|uniref:YqcC family protein n=1 Tax=unclassified Brenneria TaxID=2634434 RepID=UPI0029C2050A|nr:MULTISPECIES: YqcC family protein [unclassified Brenneria]MDX5627991.1 YqcC family protein [Brenneria sp. L3-3Z]MDX5694989.1 YqcC family protein [Brenneria sp. L4-2C]MEE3660777.1 YqcC family protein [Brenneria sp. g21c3]
MSLEDQVRQSLFDVERVLRNSPFWQQSPPESAAFASDEPFCIDTMRAEQWLQWVLLPRMHALLDSGAPLPMGFSLSPYFEEALEGAASDIEPLLAQIAQLDALFGDQPNSTDDDGDA